MLLSSSAQRARFSVGDVLLECYGGMEWACPLVSFSAIARWTMLLLPPMLGVALNIEREMGTRSFFTMNRYQSKTAWWTYKGGALLIYVVLSVGVMLMATTLAAYAAGAQGFAVFGEDAQGFSVLRTDIVWMAMILFTGHVLMLTQLQILVHSISNDMRLGILCYIVPVVLSAMMASNVDYLWNEHIPYNWGMILRTDLFFDQRVLYRRHERSHKMASSMLFTIGKGGRLSNHGSYSTVCHQSYRYAFAEHNEQKTVRITERA